MKTVCTSLRTEIAAIKTDPLAWAKAAEDILIARCGSAARYAKQASDEYLLAEAAQRLKKIEILLAEEEAKPEPKPIDMARLMRANKRTSEEFGY